MTSATTQQIAAAVLTHTAESVFAHHFANVNEIPSDARWDNGTGYLNEAVQLVKLDSGDMARSLTTDGRFIVFVGTNYGTCVVFQRYQEGSDYVVNMSDALEEILGFDGVGKLNGDHMITLLGDVNGYKCNVGQRLTHTAPHLTCQLGNPTDSKGYRSNAPVELIKMDGVFAIFKVVGEEFLVRASKGADFDAEYSSTMGLRYGASSSTLTGVLTFEGALKALCMS